MLKILGMVKYVLQLIRFSVSLQLIWFPVSGSIFLLSCFLYCVYKRWVLNACNNYTNSEVAVACVANISRLIHRSSVCLYIFCLSIHLFIYLSICPSIHPSLHYPPISLSIHLSTHMYVHHSLMCLSAQAGNTHIFLRTIWFLLVQVLLLSIFWANNIYNWKEMTWNFKTICSYFCKL